MCKQINTGKAKVDKRTNNNLVIVLKILKNARKSICVSNDPTNRCRTRVLPNQQQKHFPWLCFCVGVWYFDKTEGKAALEKEDNWTWRDCVLCIYQKGKNEQEDSCQLLNDQQNVLTCAWRLSTFSSSSELFIDHLSQRHKWAF